MCGIAAIFAYGADAPHVNRDELIAIRDHMITRGPDGFGEYIATDGRLALGHRRLAILDLSEAGAQPMWNTEQTLCTIFNGEIYNFQALRKSLADEGCVFRSQTDTEVLLHLYARKGADMVHELRGMFAFAIWDARRRSLFLARDPFGIKPLYYADDGRTIRVASQVKALLNGGHVDTSPEPAGHVGFFLWGHVPDPFTFYRGIKALPAGHTLTISATQSASSSALSPRSYSTVPDLLRGGTDRFQNGRAQDHQNSSLGAALRDSIGHHLVSDVPVGVFLSAGLDSSTIASLVSEIHPDVRTVTLGFDEYRDSALDEVPLAEQVANVCRARHQTIWVTQKDFEDSASEALRAMDQPSIDGVNTYFVSMAARRAGLKVALSGVGGDELFGGYPSFRDVPRLVGATHPFENAPGLGRAVRVVSRRFVERMTSPKYAGLLEYGPTCGGAYLLRRSLFMPWELPNLLHPDVVRAGWEKLQPMVNLHAASDGLPSLYACVMALELQWYMRHQLLRDSDWAGMAHSLEIRVPFVDAPLLRSLVPALCSGRPPTKQDMAHTPRTPLPASVLSRPKSGFMVPVRDWMMNSFDPSSARERGLRGWAREVYSRFTDHLEMHRLSLAGAKPSLRQRRSTRRSHRILVLLTDGFGGFGGISKFNRDFLSALCSHSEVAEVFAVPRIMPHDPGPLPSRLTHVTDGLSSKAAYIRTMLRLARRLRRERGTHGVPTIICGHIHLLTLAQIVAGISGGRVHLVVHGIDAWQPVGNPLTNACVRHIDGFVSVSRVTKQRFRRWARLRSDHGLVLPNCVDLDAFTPGPRPSSLLDRYKLHGRKVLLTLGRLASQERYKGFDEVLDVLGRVAEQFQDVAYMIAGDGPDRPRLASKARSLGYDVRDFSGSAVSNSMERGDGPVSARNGAPLVVFTGRISESEKVDHYRLADLYVMPSSGEGFGIVYLEALACGVPVIGSKADGSREALLEGELGTLVDPRNPEELLSAITDLLSGRKTGAALGRATVEHFSSRRFEKRVHEIVDCIAPLAVA